MAGGAEGVVGSSTTALIRARGDLGMLAVARGLALGITQGESISGLRPGFLVLGQGAFAGILIPVWIGESDLPGHEVFYIASPDNVARSVRRRGWKR